MNTTTNTWNDHISKLLNDFELAKPYFVGTLKTMTNLQTTSALTFDELNQYFGDILTQWTQCFNQICVNISSAKLSRYQQQNYQDLYDGVLWTFSKILQQVRNDEEIVKYFAKDLGAYRAKLESTLPTLFNKMLEYSIKLKIIGQNMDATTEQQNVMILYELVNQLSEPDYTTQIQSIKLKLEKSMKCQYKDICINNEYEEVAQLLLCTNKTHSTYEQIHSKLNAALSMSRKINSYAKKYFGNFRFIKNDKSLVTFSANNQEEKQSFCDSSNDICMREIEIHDRKQELDKVLHYNNHCSDMRILDTVVELSGNIAHHHAPLAQLDDL